MRKCLTALLILIILAEAIVIATLITRPEISTVEIDRDRAAVSAQITALQHETAKYTGGLIKVLLDMQNAILHQTLAMLDQKRTSYIRFITLNYTVDGHTITEASDGTLRDILEELQASERSISAAKLEASRYSGGLLQITALLKVATEEASAAGIRMKFYSAKYGIPMYTPTIEGPPKSPTKPGTVVKDREAL